MQEIHMYRGFETRSCARARVYVRTLYYGTGATQELALNAV